MRLRYYRGRILDELCVRRSSLLAFCSQPVRRVLGQIVQPQVAHVVPNQVTYPDKPTRSAMTVARSCGYSVSSARARASNGVNAVLTGTRFYFGAPLRPWKSMTDRP